MISHTASQIYKNLKSKEKPCTETAPANWQGLFPAAGGSIEENAEGASRIVLKCARYGVCIGIHGTEFVVWAEQR